MSVSQPVTRGPSDGVLGRLRPAGLGWLMWRQQRWPVRIWLTVVLLAAVATPLLRSALADYIDTHHIAGCAALRRDPACRTTGAFMAVLHLQERYGKVLKGIGAALLLLPALVGVFAGAPLIARELESGTWKLVLAQSVGRTRWVAVRIAGAGAVSLLGSAALMLLYRWLWLPVSSGLSSVTWESRAFYTGGGPVLVATTLMALATGVAAGAVLRRTLPAMAVTLGLVAGVQYALESVRPYLVGLASVPRVLDTPANVWVVEWGMVTPAGERVPFGICRTAADSCAGAFRPGGSYTDYHPAADYLPLQLVESGICLALAAGLVAFTLWWARRRLA